jgi:hypothetical protein
VCPRDVLEFVTEEKMSFDGLVAYVITDKNGVAVAGDYRIALYLRGVVSFV